MEIKPQSWAPMTSQATQATLPARPNHPFFYKWHPSNWEFVFRDIEVKSGKGTKIETRGFFIPMIRMERVVPGVNGIHQINGELGNPGSRIGKLQQQGWIYLEPQRYDYMHVYPVRGGRYHVPKWMSVRVVAGTLIEEFDTNGFQMWGVDLLCSNMLGTLEPHFWELAILKEQKIPQKLQTQQHIPEIKAKIDKSYVKIKAMKAFIEEYKTRGLDIYQDMRN
jgi:hypothetical protein